MDVLMRRYAKGARRTSVSTDHLGADELNAFAEGALPAATRSRYVSHLADCDDCRTVVSQLAMAAGAGAIAQAPASESFEKRSWWQSFGALLSMPALRYAASAAVLLAVVGIAFVVWRQNTQQRNSSLVVRNESKDTEAEAVNSPPSSVVSQPYSQPSTARDTQTTVQPTPGADRNKVGESPVIEAAPKTARDAIAPPESTIIASDRALKAPPRTDATPSYAPPPPKDNYKVAAGEREQTQQQLQQQQTNVAGNVQHGGPRRNESNEKYKSSDDRGRTLDLAKGRDEDSTRGGTNQPTPTENKQERNIQARAGTLNSMPATPAKEISEETRKSDKAGRAQSDEITSAGGRKFRRVGGIWVDLKFKSSMSLTTVSRASGDFAALDSKLRSIAQQLGGEVVVVWKGKAYRIR
jgi:hypothetical protein